MYWINRKDRDQWLLRSRRPDLSLIKGMLVRRKEKRYSHLLGIMVQFFSIYSAFREIESILCHLKEAFFFFFLHLKHYACHLQSPILLVKGLFILVLKLDCSFIVHF